MPEISSPRFARALSSRTCLRWPNNAGRTGGWGRSGAGRPQRPGRPRASPPVGGAHTHTLLPKCGKMAVSASYKGSLLRAHKSGQDPLFQQAPWTNRRNSAEFSNGPRSLKRWEQLKEGTNASPPHLPNPLSTSKYSSWESGAEILRKGGRKEESLLVLSRPKGGIKHSHSCRISPLTRVET